MADIKIDKMKYLIFLNTVKEYIDSEQNNLLEQPEKISNSKEYLLKYIEREQDIIILMEQRKLYYDFYVKNRKIDKISSNEMYKKYIETKEQIDKMREEEI